MRISVVIPSKNGLHHLKECLPTVIKAVQKYGTRVRIVVVDDNSSDGTLQQAPLLFPEVTFLQNPHRGACSARNFGVNKFPCDWICFLDNDVFVDEDFFSTAEKYLCPDVFCVTCAGYAAYPKEPGAWEQLDGVKLLEYKSGFLRFTKNIYNRDLPVQEEYPSWGVQGAYFFCNRKNFDELGGFDEILDPYLLEETDLAYRGLKRGWKIIYAPDTRLKHKCGGTINSKKSKFTQFLSKRNRILFMWKNVQAGSLRFASWMRLWTSCSPRLWKECLRRRWALRTQEREDARLAVVSDRALLEQSSSFLREVNPMALLQRKLNILRQERFLRERLFRYGEKYGSVWKIAFHLVNASILSLRFYRPKSVSLTGPLRICLSLEGGLGDLMVGLNWVCGFYKKFSPLCQIQLDIAFSNKQMVKAFVPDFVHQIILLKEKKQKSYDLIINCVRCPVVEYADVSRLPAAVLMYTQKLLDFEHEHRDLLLLTPYKDTVTRNIFSSCVKRWHQADILDELNLTEEFGFSVPIHNEKETLKKFNLYGKKYITLNREGGSDQGWESTKLWPLSYYRKLVEELKRVYPNYELVEVGAGRGERMNNTHRNLAGKTSLEEINVILKHAVLHIDGEGGLVHLRHALKAGPSCVFFGPTSPEVYGYEENLNLRSSACSVCCEFYSKTWQRKCLRGKCVCMESLSPEYVLEQIEAACLLPKKEKTK